MKTRYEEYLSAYPNSEDCVERVLKNIRRLLSEDESEYSDAVLEAFDKACDHIGVPFISP